MVTLVRRSDTPEITARVFANPGEFRAWLEEHHDTAKELWVGYYKKGVPKTSMSYKEAVDQALCYGWIDGIGRRIDDEVHANRFSPRTKRSTWSAINVARMQELIQAGLARPAGIRAFDARTPNRTGIYSYENRPADLPEVYRSRLEANERAHAWWQAQPPGYRRAVTWWVVSAKQEATRQRRLDALIADSEAGRPVKPMTYGTAKDPSA
jgi:uncharacterized protein YdeI (YjbR/CyaY-like superfamily)